MKSLYDEYIEACKSELRESTWDKKRRMFESTILPLVGDIKLDRFSVAAAQKFKTGIVSRDIKRTTAGNYCIIAQMNMSPHVRTLHFISAFSTKLMITR